MNKIIGLILLGFFVFFCSKFFNVDFTPTIEYYAQLIISGVGGAGVLLYEFSNLIKLPALPNFNTPHVTNTIKLSPSEVEEADFRCLIHLRNRMLESKNEKGLALVNQINSVIFDINQANNVNK